MSNAVEGAAAAPSTSGTAFAMQCRQKDIPQSPRPTSPFTPPATGEVKIGHGRRTRSSSGEHIVLTDVQRDTDIRDQGAFDEVQAPESRHPCKRARVGSQTRDFSPSVNDGESARSGSVESVYSEDLYTNGHVDGDYYATVNDTPHNPFLRGAPADRGFSGKNAGRAHQRQSLAPPREMGKMTYVFRGQRVTYADPYGSDSESEQGEAQFNGVRGLPRDRLKPRLLFPSAHLSRPGGDNGHSAADEAAPWSTVGSSDMASISSTSHHPSSDCLEAPVPQAARSPARGLLGLCAAAEQHQRLQREQSSFGSGHDAEAPWADPELAMEQEQMRKHTRINPTARELLARMDGTDWKNDGDELMCDKDGRHLHRQDAPWYPANTLGNAFNARGHLSTSFGLHSK